jgi:hypothetical protein
MATIPVYELFKRRALVTRESARELRQHLGPLTKDRTTEADITLDFSGIDAVTPSFVDETLQAIGDAVGTNRRKSTVIIFLHPPTRLSEKFAAIGRARGVVISEIPGEGWRIVASR